MRVFSSLFCSFLPRWLARSSVSANPDIPRATLEAKYATPPSRFVVLADGSRAHARDRGPRNAPVLLLAA
jgi:hypothetical protein